MPLDNFFTDCQSHAGAGELLSFVESLEHAKDPLEELWIDAEPVIFHGKHPSLTAVPGSGDVYSRDSRLLILDGIAYKILEKLDDLVSVRLDSREGIVSDESTAIDNCAAKIHEGLIQRFFAGYVECFELFFPDA